MHHTPPPQPFNYCTFCTCRELRIKALWIFEECSFFPDDLRLTCLVKSCTMLCSETCEPIAKRLFSCFSTRDSISWSSWLVKPSTPAHHNNPETSHDYFKVKYNSLNRSSTHLTGSRTERRPEWRPGRVWGPRPPPPLRPRPAASFWPETQRCAQRPRAACTTSDNTIQYFKTLNGWCKFLCLYINHKSEYTLYDTRVLTLILFLPMSEET